MLTVIFFLFFFLLVYPISLYLYPSLSLSPQQRNKKKKKKKKKSQKKKKKKKKKKNACTRTPKFLCIFLRNARRPRRPPPPHPPPSPHANVNSFKTSVPGVCVCEGGGAWPPTGYRCLKKRSDERPLNSVLQL